MSISTQIVIAAAGAFLAGLGIGIWVTWTSCMEALRKMLDEEGL